MDISSLFGGGGGGGGGGVGSSASSGITFGPDTGGMDRLILVVAVAAVFLILAALFLKK